MGASTSTSNPGGSGRVALVTGASRGIGRAIAERLARDGFTVAVHYRAAEEDARGVLAALAGDGHALFRADLADAEGAERLVAEVATGLGGIDLLVNNAGVYREHPIAEVDYRDWRRHWQEIVAVDLLGPVNLIFCALPHLRARGGKVVNITSRGAFRGEPTAPAYGASKAGLNAASQSLAVALAPHGVGVYAVAPGWVDTDMAAAHLEAVRHQSPLGRVARPEEVAAVVAFLAGAGTEYLTGAIIDVNGASYLRS